MLCKALLGLVEMEVRGEVIFRVVRWTGGFGRDQDMCYGQ